MGLSLLSGIWDFGDFGPGEAEGGPLNTKPSGEDGNSSKPC